MPLVVRIVSNEGNKLDYLTFVSVLMAVEGLTILVVNLIRDVEVPTTSEVYVDKASEVSV
jgi:hypothetical protein